MLLSNQRLVRTARMMHCTSRSIKMTQFSNFGLFKHILSLLYPNRLFSLPANRVPAWWLGGRGGGGEGGQSTYPILIGLKGRICEYCPGIGCSAESRFHCWRQLRTQFAIKEIWWVENYLFSSVTMSFAEQKRLSRQIDIFLRSCRKEVEERKRSSKSSLPSANHERDDCYQRQSNVRVWDILPPSLRGGFTSDGKTETVKHCATCQCCMVRHQ
jgi:hypothetical protein